MDLATISHRRQRQFVKLFVYSFSGVCAATAGIIITADIQGADASNAGLWLELDAILAVVLGGTSLNGGRFSLPAILISVLTIQAMTTTIIISGIDPQYNLSAFFFPEMAG